MSEIAIVNGSDNYQQVWYFAVHVSGNQYATITHPIHYRESTVVTFTLKPKSLLAVKCHDEQKVCT